MQKGLSGLNRLTKMKKKLTFVLLMSMITTGIVSFTVIAANIGFEPYFFKVWLKSWAVGYVVAVPSILLIAPKIEKMVNNYVKV